MAQMIENGRKRNLPHKVFVPVERGLPAAITTLTGRKAEADQYDEMVDFADAETVPGRYKSERPMWVASQKCWIAKFYFSDMSAAVLFRIRFSG